MNVLHAVDEAIERGVGHVPTHRLDWAGGTVLETTLSVVSVILEEIAPVAIRERKIRMRLRHYQGRGVLGASGRSVE